VLRLFESNEVSAPHVLPGGPGVPQPLPQQGGSGHWEDQVRFEKYRFLHVLHNFTFLFLIQSYFSEPEFDTEYSHQHVHKNKVS
jgi:SRC kinase signaling inhibitor 1